MVDVSRRRTLKAIGTSALIGLGTGIGSANNRQRVFVHPDSDQSKAVEALQDHGGKALITYNNWDFVAGKIPSKNRGDLEADSRVKQVENDGEVYEVHHRDGHDGGPPGDGGGDDDGGGSTSQNPSWGYDRVDADQVTEATGAGVEIAILDGGIDGSHDDLDVHGSVNCTGRGQTDNSDHGTHCAGIAAALDNDLGVVGIASAADLYAVKVLHNGSGYWSWIVCGIDHCVTAGHEVLSMSFGASGMPDSMHTAVEDASAAGHLLVAAAGNDGNDEDGDCEENNVIQPARHTDVIAVSASENDSDLDNSSDTHLADYSSVGPEVEIMAPGTNIRSTITGNSYDEFSGTSMACPHVSGAGGLLWEIYGSDGPNTSDRDAIRDILTGTAEVLSDVGSCEQGAGLLDVEAAADEAATRTS